MEKKINKEIRLNVNYFVFVKECIEKNIVDIEVLKKKYESEVGLKYWNVERVYNRSERKGVKELKDSLVLKEKIDLKKFRDKEKEIVLKLSENKGNGNYLSVEI